MNYSGTRIVKYLKLKLTLLDSKLFSSRKYVSHIYTVASLRTESETALYSLSPMIRHLSLKLDTKATTP